MSEALLELGGTAGDEQLRARMAALHGREDPLLESPRFARLLRQANDAEVADVRKVGDDAYEITLARRGGAASPAAARPAAANGSAAAPTAESAPAAAVARPGIRFRRGSRAPARPGELALIGVVSVDGPTGAEAAAAETPAPASAEPEAAPAAKPARKSAKGTRKKAAKAADAKAPDAKAPDAKPATRPARKPGRPRAKKPAE